jgi:hypothetical protein
MVSRWDSNKNLFVGSSPLKRRKVFIRREQKRKEKEKKIYLSISSSNRLIHYLPIHPHSTLSRVIDYK